MGWGFFNKIKNAVKKGANAVVNAVKKGVELGKKVIDNAAPVLQKVGSVAQAAGSIMGGAAGQALQNVGNLANTAGRVTQNVSSAIGNRDLNQLRDSFKQGTQDLKAGGQQLMNSGRAAFQDLRSRMR